MICRFALLITTACPALEGHECPELGHRNYQHPARTKDHFGPYLDNFSAWSIYVSLFTLSRDASLMQAVVGGDESLLFRQYDYKNPTRSPAFAVLEEHSDSEIADLARKFRAMLALPPEAVPYLGDDISNFATADLPPLEVQRRKARVAAQAATVSSNLPDWMIEEAPDVRQGAEDEASGADDEVDFRESIAFASRKAVAATADVPWPTLSQYSKAVSVPAASFLDAELQMCRPVRVDGRVLVQKSQQNAVFRLQRGARSIAIKVFLSPDDTRTSRYQDFLRFMRAPRAVEGELTKYLPRIDYIEQGIRVEDRLYPIVKMEWIEGQTLEQLEADAANLGRVDSARHQFRQLVQTMERCGFVHGELEPSNIIVSPEGLKLIDFDAVRVPGALAPLAVSQSSLRHPRESHYVDVYTDNFPAWVIDTALVILREQPELRFVKLPGQFIFGHEDFLFPERSDILQTMRDSMEAVVHQRYQLLQSFIKMEPYRLPPLTVDASIDKVFARNHNLDFPEVSPGRVSPDVKVSPPVAVPYRNTQLDLISRPGNALEAPEAVHKFGAFVLLAITIGLLGHSGMIPALPFFCFFLIWVKLLGPKKD